MAANTSPRTVGIFKALSEPNRIRILNQLQKCELCACKLPERIGLTQPAVSLHLKMLLSNGLVQVRLEGSNRMYSLTGLGRKVLSDTSKW